MTLMSDAAKRHHAGSWAGLAVQSETVKWRTLIEAVKIPKI
jgi:hypothetical protein